MLTRGGDTAWTSRLRVYAALAVVAIHVGSSTAKLSPGSLDWIVATLTDAACRWCVPIFFMVSGYFLLDPAKTETLSVFYRKRASRLLAPIVFWSIFYTAFTYYTKPGLTVGDLVYSLLVGMPAEHLWYLFAICGLYAFTPFLRMVMATTTSSQRWVLVTLLFAIPIGDGLWGLLQSARAVRLATAPPSFLTLFVPYLGYYVCGYQIRTTRGDRISDAILWLAAAGSILAIFVANMLLTRIGVGKDHLYGYLFGYLSPPVILMSLAIFLLAARHGPRRSQGSPLLARVAKMEPATLGIYIIHPVVISILGLCGVRSSMWPAPVSIPVLTVVVFVLSYAATQLIRKVPYLRTTV